MALHPLAGQKAPAEYLTNIPRLVSAYYLQEPDLETNPELKVAFGTSGHRGCSLDTTFNESHILCIVQAICEYRKANGINGPLFLGKDTHALSEAAFNSAIEVLVANEVEVYIAKDFGFTPTPVISHAVVSYNRAGHPFVADGIVITPSHNPPQDGGIKYNPPNGGPADTDVTKWIEDRANQLLLEELTDVEMVPYTRAIKTSLVREYDYITPYVADLANVVDLPAIAKANVAIGVDALGGSGIAYWAAIQQAYGLKLTELNKVIDPSFAFMPLDKDGKIRMDCSSPYAMRNLLQYKDQFAVCIGNDPDFDRHGIVTPEGLMNPNHYLAVAIDYLLQHRPQWPADLAIGKTLVSSALIDKVVAKHQRQLCEVPVGFKWFVDGLAEHSLAFGGEESAGASFLRRDGTTWNTDKDGIILGLLAAEITAVTGMNPNQYYQQLVAEFGAPVYERIDVAGSLRQRELLKKLSADDFAGAMIAGDSITAILSKAPGNNAAIGGVKVCTEHGWFAARPSGTEDIYKIYMESFKGEQHLAAIEHDAVALLTALFAKHGV